MLKCYQKPPLLNMDLSRATRKLMKFSLVLHFLVGLYMYSNSSILTGQSVSSQILNQLSYNNEYFNKERFSDLHVIIFLAAFGLMLLILILRLTLVSWITSCVNTCKKIKQRFLKDETTVSDDIIEELNFNQLWAEFKKTKYDLIDYRAMLDEPLLLENTKAEIRAFLDKAESKQLKIVNMF